MFLIIDLPSVCGQATIRISLVNRISWGMEDSSRRALLFQLMFIIHTCNELALWGIMPCKENDIAINSGSNF